MNVSRFVCYVSHLIGILYIVSLTVHCVTSLHTRDGCDLPIVREYTNISTNDDTVRMTRGEWQNISDTFWMSNDTFAERCVWSVSNMRFVSVVMQRQHD